MKVVVTPFAGDPDIYVSTTQPHPNTTAYDKMGSMWGMDVITMSTQDLADFAGGYVYIGVFGYRSAIFSLVASTSRGMPMLAQGVPCSGRIESDNSPNVYKVRVKGGVDVTFYAKSSYGAVPNLFASQDESVSSTNFKWQGTFGDLSGTTLVISSKDLRPGLVYVAVQGKTLSRRTLSYLITASTDTDITTLMDGVAQTGRVAVREHKFYRFFLQDNGFSLRVKSLNGGDPDLFIAFYPKPTKQEADAGQEVVFTGIVSGDDVFDTRALGDKFRTGWYYASVYGYPTYNSSFVEFEITATTYDTIVILEDGRQVTNDYPAGNSVVRFFSMESSDPDKGAAFQLTDFSGNTTMYVALNNTHPNASRCDWITDPGTQTVVIRSDDPKLQAAFTASSTGSVTFFVAVVASPLWGAATQDGGVFQIIGLTAADAVVLDKGQPARGTVAAGSNNYYKIYVNQDNSMLEVSLSALSGNPDLYVARADRTKRPSELVNDAKSTAFGGDALTLPVSSGWYYICVRGTQNSSYVITTQFGAGDVQLIDGITVRGSIANGHTRFYQVDLRAAALTMVPIQLQVTVIHGWVDIYFENSSSIQQNDRIPQSNSYIGWAREGRAFSQPSQYPPGFYSLGIKGIGTAEFNVRISITRPITLIEGSVEVSSMAGSSTRPQVFQFYVDNADATLGVNFRMKKLSGVPTSRPYFYVTTVNSIPGEAINPHWRAVPDSTDPDNVFSVNIPTTDPNYRSHAMYYIGVYSYAPMNFTMEADAGDRRSELIGGIEQTRFVFKDQYNYFRYSTGETGLFVEVEPCTGLVSIAMDEVDEYPVVATAGYKAVGSVGGNPVIESSKLINRRVYIGVTADSDTDFSIYAGSAKRTYAFTPGGNGVLNITAQGTVATIEFARALEDPSLPLEYRMYTAEADSTPLFHTVCGVRAFGKEVAHITAGEATKVKLDHLDQFRWYYLNVIAENPMTGEHVAYQYVRFAIGDPATQGLGGFAIFMITVTCIFFSYFLGGFLFLKFVRHESGWRAIPHYQFWYNLVHCNFNKPYRRMASSRPFKSGMDFETLGESPAFTGTPTGTYQPPQL
eukprot:GILJ01004662.1.p1 GENE.GILJ01004662.1~~GILJ01004662.1.p1  ORF type:complete len:1257 (-),score=201.85 GILJ01004662.1:275-3508(-)